MYTCKSLTTKALYDSEQSSINKYVIRNSPIKLVSKNKGKPPSVNQKPPLSPPATITVFGGDRPTPRDVTRGGRCVRKYTTFVFSVVVREEQRGINNDANRQNKNIGTHGGCF